MAKVRVELEKERGVEKARETRAPSEKRNEIAKLLIRESLLTEEQLHYAQRIHAKLTTQRSLLSILEELQYVSKDQVQEALRASPVSVPHRFFAG